MLDKWVPALLLYLALQLAEGELPLQLSSEQSLDAAGRDVSALAGKSIYFLLVDRFARSDGNLKPCGNKEAEDNIWCGGTLRGAMEHLDYIQGMGFDCIWITPVVMQYPGSTLSGTGAMGYWARDLYRIDPHFGTAADYKQLIAEIHRRGMCIVQDFVANHMGPIHSSKDVEPMHPFNKTEYFHQLFIGKMSFDEYTSKQAWWPPPAQAMWSQSGAQCTQNTSCDCYRCDSSEEAADHGDWGPCEGEMVFNDEGPCPKNSLSDFCMPGDYQCQGYNETITQEGWFYDLGDLNQSHPFVRAELLKWISWYVKEYSIDALRLDTAAFMPFNFLSELQEAAGVPIIGEVTATNLTYHAQFQANPPPSGRATLAGVLNFPLYFTASAAFCHTWFPFSEGNLTFLGERIQSQASGLYSNLDTLGNFMDNHDEIRATETCEEDRSRVLNLVTWVMLSKGVAIAYYGTEVFMTRQRESFWTYGYDRTTVMYKYLQTLNRLRKDYGLALAGMEIVPTSDQRTLVFKRGPVWVFLNNYPATHNHGVPYCGTMLPELRPYDERVNALSEGPLTSPDGYFTGSCFWAHDTHPRVLVQRS